jgi:hypothetical protein
VQAARCIVRYSPLWDRLTRTRRHP